jgi:hypothetical protein
MENDTTRNFAEELIRMRKCGEPKGSALLSTELTPRDLAVGRIILRNSPHTQDIDRLAMNLSTTTLAKSMREWITQHGVSKAARIVILMERMSKK